MTLLSKAKARAEQVARDLGHEGSYDWRTDRHGWADANAGPIVRMQAGPEGEWFMFTGPYALSIGGGKVTEET